MDSATVQAALKPSPQDASSLLAFWDAFKEIGRASCRERVLMPV